MSFEYTLANLLANNDGAIAVIFVDETGEIWSHDGRLLVQSRQLSLLIPLPEMPARPEMEWIDP